MNRIESVVSLGSLLLVAAAGKSAEAAAISDASVRPAADPSSFRWLVPVLEYRVGVLTEAGTMVISRGHDTRRVLVNIPRPARGDTGWRPAKPPDMPYYTNSQRVTDVLTYGGPDFVMAAAAINFEAVFGVVIPGVGSPNFLIRIAPHTLAMQTYALPDDGHGAALAFFKAERQHQLTIGRQDGTLTLVDYPPTI